MDRSSIARPRFLERRGPALQRLVLTGGAQTAMQVLAFATGLVVIRVLPVDEYAFYTLAMAALGTMTVLSDCGISQAVLSSGGRVWRDPDALGGVVSGGLRLRMLFASGAGTLCSIVLIVLLTRRGATFAQATLVTAGAIPLLLATTTSQLYEVVPRLQQNILPLQHIQLASAGIRLITVAAVTMLWPVAWVVGLAAGITQLWTSWRVRHLALTAAHPGHPCPPEAWAEMLRMLRRTAPSAVYYAFAGQVSVWLISVFGNTERVAQVGALTRLAMLFNILSTVFALMVVPRFARMQAGQALLFRWFWVVQLVLILPLIAVVAVVARFPSESLAILGGDYRVLSTEVVLVAASGAMTLLSGCAYSLAAARGVVAAPAFVIVTAITLQVGLALTLPISTVAGVLWLQLISNIVFWFLHAVNFSRTVLR